jgi:thioredoxin
MNAQSTTMNGVSAVTKWKSSYHCAAVLLIVAAAGCKSDPNAVVSSLSESPYGSLVDATIESPVTQAQAAEDPNSVSLASLQTTTEPIKILQSNERLGDLVNGPSGVVLLDFYADWCGPCRKQSEVLHDMVESGAVDAQIIKINIEEHPRLALQYEVSSLPTLLVLRDGVVQQSKVGYTERAELESMLR